VTAGDKVVWHRPGRSFRGDGWGQDIDPADEIVTIVAPHRTGSVQGFRVKLIDGSPYFVPEAELEATRSITPRIGHNAMEYASNGVSAVAYVSPDQEPDQYRRSFDVGETIDLLRAAVTALEGGDGVEAVKACGAAWFRISSFHHT
jgi:hypothetical protein